MSKEQRPNKIKDKENLKVSNKQKEENQQKKQNQHKGKEVQHINTIIFDSDEFNQKFYYKENDLGNIYTKEKTSFRVWAPTASKIEINLYKEGCGGNQISVIDMERNVSGTWTASIVEDLNGIYYTYKVTVQGVTTEAVDPYARTTGLNGERGMIIDTATCTPKGWEQDVKPPFLNETEAIIYELHVRDLSSDISSGVVNVGKFLGLTETGTKNKDGFSTGLEHIKELGITHLHLLPVFDYATVDEEQLEKEQYNWGYDPQNYNALEGSYSTDPYHGEVRVLEFKEMVKILHANGIRVVMDVVYNHTYFSNDSNLNKIVPNYYYRIEENQFSNGSGCGNELASEHSMVRKYIVDSVVYWATEYHLDGFRFDLMGLHDIDTMNVIREAINKVDPSILIYGEGWVGGKSQLDESLRSSKINVSKLNQVAVFNDDIRDAIKGNVFKKTEKGFISGKQGLEDAIRFGIVAATPHKQVKKLKAWALEPNQCINYVSAHDDLTLFDKIALSSPDKDKTDWMKQNKLAAAIVLTSQGIPFFQAGEEILRSKVKKDGTFVENSYKSFDIINSIKWNEKSNNLDVFNYYKGLIEFRKAHYGLRMKKSKEIQKNLVFQNKLPKNVVAYTIEERAKKEGNYQRSECICVIHNAREEEVTIPLTKGKWDIYVNHEKAGTKVLGTIMDRKARVMPVSTMVLVQERYNSSFYKTITKHLRRS